MQPSAKAAELERRSQLQSLIWFPSPKVYSPDGTSEVLIESETATFELAEYAAWLPTYNSSADAAGALTTSACHDCATYTVSGKLNVPQSTFNYWAYPFDRQTLSFRLAFDSASVVTCDLLFGDALSPDNLAALLPDTNEWQLATGTAADLRLYHLDGDTRICQVEVHVKRNPIVFTIKQVGAPVCPFTSARSVASLARH